MAKQVRSERTLERLVVSAAEQFADQGFVRATLADVSKSAGVTKGALFFHFSTKDDLADVVQARGRDVLETLVEELHDSDASRLQVLVDLTHSLNTLLRENAFIRASVRITRERTHQEPTPLDFYPMWLGRLWKLLGDARTNGELAKSVADVSARTVVTAAVSGVETLAWMGVSRQDAEEWLSDLWGLVLPLLTEEGPERLIRTAAPPVAVVHVGEES
ncbi:ScbR family autoregulator-binding transcription factor [Streptomyces sp. SH5]|uniref:ScbR family autoregulator-binding transcription factor n=1 Tax=Streptomyces sindenensis TaxID=67363 RepID=A0ABW6ERF4_9ACTN|nr:ScbR family autoregulator-binding transcription factor [Streptomyces sp. SH5]WGP09692.1 ScbR family autoregulator-binding transcription factor [Streptomyces sp. SH5]